MEFSLIIPAFIAGILTFLAPCTLPLVPGYLGFISAASLEDLKNPDKVSKTRLKIFLNGLFFIIGFSLIFILLGTLFGFIGSTLVTYKLWLSSIGGIFVILFGLFMTNLVRVRFWARETHFKTPPIFERGKPVNSLLLGSAFGLGWTPCVGPVLGSILFLASTSTTALQGAFMLLIFSAGLAVPFLLIAAGIGQASNYISGFLEVTTKYRVLIMVIFGVVTGILLNPLFTTPSALKILALNLRLESSILPINFPNFIIPLVTAGLLGLTSHFKKLDTVSVIGGVFFMYLGILLLTDNLGLLVSHGYNLLKFINYEALIDYL